MAIEHFVKDRLSSEHDARERLYEIDNYNLDEASESLCTDLEILYLSIRWFLHYIKKVLNDPTFS
jgi:hypothetical protein